MTMEANKKKRPETTVKTSLLQRATVICINDKQFIDMKLREKDVIKTRLDFYVKDMRK